MSLDQNLAAELFAKNSNLKSFETLMRHEPIPSLADLPALRAAELNLDVPLDQVSIAVPYSVCLFNKRYFWETHEVLEDIWMDEYGPTRAFLQGFIQGAAALYHVIGQNPSGYERLSRLSREKLEKFKMPQLGVDLTACLDSFLIFDRQHHLGNRFDHTMLPKITFAGISL